MGTTTSSSQIEALLDFWFGPARHDPAAIQQQYGLWFQAGAAEDAAVREHFEPVLEQATGGHLSSWLDSVQGRLALILACDQAPRMMYRRQPQAFAWDHHALALSLAGLGAGVDRGLSLAERVFFYLPLEHSEDRLVQAESLRQFEQLKVDFPEHGELAGSFLRYARDHAAVIERFGRFPHRNATLGRKNTPEEEVFLADAPRWGQ